MGTPKVRKMVMFKHGVAYMDGATSTTKKQKEVDRFQNDDRVVIMLGQMLCGVVHDPTSRRMGGITGHAGLFTTATDLARYARMILSGGQLDTTGVDLIEARRTPILGFGLCVRRKRWQGQT